MRQFLFLILLLFLGHTVHAQKRELLDSVVLKASNIRTQSVGQNIVEIKSSEIKKYRPQLTDVLNFETPIFFKENGLGMVSSPSFRGTTAQQTAVLWNGINVNSTFLGQVDFNTLSAHGYSDIFSTYLREQGYDARVVETQFEGELGEIGESNTQELQAAGQGGGS